MGAFLTWCDRIAAERKKITIALVVVAIAFSINIVACTYVSTYANTAQVPDLILDHFGPYDLSILYVYGYLLFLAIYFLYPLLLYPRLYVRAVNLFSSVMIIRAFFLVLTHLRCPADAILTSFPGSLAYGDFTNDLFFSGHTALPFLGFLLFKNRVVRYTMLALSVILGGTALLMHRHYSIDFFAAYFIAYGVFTLGSKYLK